jgi:hypothetical protein
MSVRIRLGAPILKNASSKLKNFKTIIFEKKKHSVLFVGVWCNDNTTGFELVVLGLIPSTPAS